MRSVCDCGFGGGGCAIVERGEAFGVFDFCVWVFSLFWGKSGIARFWDPFGSFFSSWTIGVGDFREG